MANYDNIARPYALAAFDYAKEKELLSEWRVFLASAALVARDPAVLRLLENPETRSTQLLDLFCQVLEKILSNEMRNFLHLLALNDRLIVLPEIHRTYKILVAELEKISHIRVVTATDTDEAYRQKLAGALTKRIHQEVKLNCEVDPNIIGGAIIYIGDRVIDGSIRGKLTRLLESSLR